VQCSAASKTVCAYTCSSASAWWNGRIGGTCLDEGGFVGGGLSSRRGTKVDQD
jgi:hypothetical protein